MKRTSVSQSFIRQLEHLEKECEYIGICLDVSYYDEDIKRYVLHIEIPEEEEVEDSSSVDLSKLN